MSRAENFPRLLSASHELYTRQEGRANFEAVWIPAVLSTCYSFHAQVV